MTNLKRVERKLSTEKLMQNVVEFVKELTVGVELTGPNDYTQT